MKYSDSQRLQKIKEKTDKLLSYLDEKNINSDVVLRDETVRWTITTPLYNIGEHVYYLSDEVKDFYPDVPWSKISGLRHRLVHDYDGTDWSIINSILFKTLREFQAKINEIISNYRG